MATGTVAAMALQLHLAAGPRAVEPPGDGEVRDPAAIRVALVDDHARVARGLRLLLERHDAIAVDGDEHRRHLLAPDVVVLDLQLSGGAGIAAIRQLRQRVPSTPIVVLSGDRDPVFARQALATGAAGFVLRHRADSELGDAVCRAAHGEAFVSAPIAAALAALDAGDGVSLRETEVLRLIALGYTSAEIASELHVSRRTVDSHRASIHRKLGLSSRAELVQFALSHHLLAC